MACTDGDIPLCAFVSSANLNDAKAIIPMMQKVSEGSPVIHTSLDMARLLPQEPEE